MIEIITFKNRTYPKFQSEGFAAKFAFPFAKEVCKGEGYDIGCNREEWKFPGSIAIDPIIDSKHHATKLPEGEMDYIFSSHCLEHIPNWIETLDYWYNVLRDGGILFLYLPDRSQEYWLPWNNRKHIHSFYPKLIEMYLMDKGYKNVMVSGVDLNNSFMAMAEK